MKPFCSELSLPHRPPKCLTIAGFDPFSFAGVTADLRTFSSLGVFGVSVITALTVQSPLRFDRCSFVDAELFSQQIESILEQFGPLPTKIGIVASPELAGVLVERLCSSPSAFIVLDPVLSPSAGAGFSFSSFYSVTMERLFPLISVVTPNIPEAEAILGRSIRDSDSMSAAATEIHGRFGCSVLIKGGHLPVESDPCDLLCHDRRIYRFDSPRAAVGSVHGSGCFLSASIVAFSALGQDIPQAIGSAKKHISKAFSAPVDIGGFPLLHSSP